MTTVAQGGHAPLRYTSVAIALHWAIALAIVFQLAGGIWMVDFAAENSNARFFVYQIHKTVGLLILALSLARLIWRLGHPAPASQPNWTPLERTASHVVHVAFYVVMLAGPVSGWLMVSASPTNIPTFLLLQEWLPFAHIPGLHDFATSSRESLEAFSKLVHYYLGLLTIALLVLHVGAALKHQLIDRDRILDRMRVTRGSAAPTGSSPLNGIIAIILGAGFIGFGVIAGTIQSQQSAATTSAALSTGSGGDWAILPEDSSLGFELTYNGNAVTGTFSNWTSTIRFDPDDLANANAVVEIDMASYVIDDSTLQVQAEGEDGFSPVTYPTARFESTAFREREAGTDSDYVMDGTLTLRGISKTVSVPFSFEAEDDLALVRGSATLNRLDFGIGAIGASDEAWLKHEVRVHLDLRAERN